MHTSNDLQTGLFTRASSYYCLKGKTSTNPTWGLVLVVYSKENYDCMQELVLNHQGGLNALSIVKALDTSKRLPTYTATMHAWIIFILVQFQDQDIRNPIPALVALCMLFR